MLIRDKILIINGPNLNFLGKREKDIYGNCTMTEIQNYTEKKLEGRGVELTWYQSNIEGEIVSKIQEAVSMDLSCLIINPGGYTHTSVAILDALKILSCNVVEVHISNTMNRDDFRKSRVTTLAASGVIEGLGKDTYLLAVLSHILKREQNDSTAEFKKGLKVELEGKPYLMAFCQFVNPGKGSAFFKTKLKNLITGAVIERTFKSGVDTGLEAPDLEEREMEHMYADHEGYHFMDQNTYESVCLSDEQVGESRYYFQETIKVKILYYKARPVTVDLPNFVELKVKETDPGLKGDTASGGMKKAIMDTGLQVNVPLFIKNEEVLKIDTRTGEYVERVK